MTAATATTPEKRYAYRKFILKYLPVLLPCKTCSDHLKTHLKILDIDKYMSSNETLLLFSYLLHEKVNKMLGKKGISFEACKEKYLPKEGSSLICTTTCEETTHDTGQPIATMQPSKRVEAQGTIYSYPYVPTKASTGHYDTTRERQPSSMPIKAASRRFMYH